MHEEVLDGEPPGFAHHSLSDAKRRVRLVGGAHCAALITQGGPRLLQALRLAGTHLQLLSEVLVHALRALAGATAATGAAAVSEHAHASCQAHGEGGRHGLVASGAVFCIHRHPTDATVLVLTALPGCDILRSGRSARILIWHVLEASALKRAYFKISCKYC